MAALTQSEVTKVLAAIKELTGSGELADLRQDPRHHCAVTLWLRRLPDGPSVRPGLFKVSLTDASKKGVGFLSRRPFVKGERFVLPIRFAEGGGQLVLCRARFCTNVREHYRIGAEFLAQIPDEDGKARIPEEWANLKP